MRLLKWLYTRIIRKLDLSVAQLRDLKDRLKPSNICSGPCIKENKMCPNTTALAIKEGENKFQNSTQVKQLLRQYGITSIELWLYYIVSDIPAMLSKRFFKNALESMRSSIDTLIRRKETVKH